MNNSIAPLPEKYSKKVAKLQQHLFALIYILIIVDNSFLGNQDFTSNK